MLLPKRNLSEYSIVMMLSKITICQQDDLNSEMIRKEFNEDYPCHIYFICKRPRIMIVPQKCYLDKGILTLTFSIQKQFKFYEESLSGFLPMKFDDFKLESKFPYTRFQILNYDKIIAEAKSSLYYAMHLQNYNNDLDLEVLYIGQSYGEYGNRNSIDRLIQHSTLQKIYSEAIQNNPDSEIWLNLLSFERQMVTSFDGTTKYPIENESNNLKKTNTALQKFISNQLNEKQIINFTEASLIKYFKPKYNIEYKEKFPNPAHKSYSECYDLDVNSVAFLIDSNCIATRFFSSNIEPAFEHFGSFTMETKAKRISMFDLFDNGFKIENSNFKIE